MGKQVAARLKKQYAGFTSDQRFQKMKPVMADKKQPKMDGCSFWGQQKQKQEKAAGQFQKDSAERWRIVP